MTDITTLPGSDNEDAILDHIQRLWKEADGLTDEARELEDEAFNKTKQAEEKRDEADELAQPLILAHPGWKDLLEDGEDPRVAIAEAAFDAEQDDD